MDLFALMNLPDRSAFREFPRARRGPASLVSPASLALLLALAALGASACGDDGSNKTIDRSDGGDGGRDNCNPGDQDGVIGGKIALQVTIDDTSFTPPILKTQNLASVTLTVKNTGSKPHDFVVDCLPTPNADGCPTTSCFPDAAKIPFIAPGTSAVTTFALPGIEGIYDFKSDLAGDTQTGQFILQ